jgi:HEAT repeat protein
MSVDYPNGWSRATGRTRAACVISALVVALGFDASRVHAEAAPDVSAGDRLKQITAALESGELEATRTGLVRLRSEQAQGPYLDLLIAALGRGGAEPVVMEALSLAETWAKPELGAAVAPYVKHRNPRVRIAASRALAKTGGADSVKALRSCLRSADAALREACVVSLGQVGDPIAVGDLFLALDRGLAAAALAIGRLCDDAGCQKLGDRLGDVPFEAMGQGIVEVILRTDARVKSATRVELIARVANLRTPQAAHLLRGAKSRFPQKGDRAVSNALDSAIESFGGQ